jgi:isopenicillin N synthase-like dioxygenase
MATTNGHTKDHTGQIPVIDLSGSLPEYELAKELVNAVATYGFVYIKNEGKDIPVGEIDRIFDLVRRILKLITAS